MHNNSILNKKMVEDMFAVKVIAPKAVAAAPKKQVISLLDDKRSKNLGKTKFSLNIFFY